MVTTAAPWQNPVNRLDVLGQGNTIVPADALAIINYLNLNPAGLKLPASFPAGSDYLDVLGTGIVVPDDALQVIDYLNLHPAVVNEAVVAPQVPRAGGGGIVGTATGAAAPVFLTPASSALSPDIRQPSPGQSIVPQATPALLQPARSTRR